MALLPEHTVALVNHGTCDLGMIDLEDFATSKTDRFTAITESPTICGSNYAEDTEQNLESATFQSIDQILQPYPGRGEYFILDRQASNIRLIDWCTGVVKNVASTCFFTG